VAILDVNGLPGEQGQSDHRDGPHTRAVSLSGGAMVRRAYRHRSLVEVLPPDSDKLWDSAAGIVSSPTSAESAAS
jgi:hypothetical protein